ncbi:DUF4230 domain-containing protein [Antarcticibacterium flavum]|uniref:DUF4230 domain-containing protein n=1 Tax=Antarcticibacterium flavum TaxID=2058175 RepID=A0A5B7X7U0_9FLAO|nr:MULTISPECIES: DUF4230 domain-containing protein [Antarcticibacterium]MCM4159556.1 hypothetical protein [Antarcticibacterium sp. W02-3]QCY70808.1 DUF4230 domain-containing protein [Antarcticibacterium flavum]
MRKIIPIILLVLAVSFGWKYFESRNDQRDQLVESTDLIEKQIKNVGKLVVTEGNFAQVYSYNDSRKFYLDILSARKKALIIVNADVTVAYDLSKLRTEIDPDTRTVRILYIPEEEISINPNIRYYDVTQDYLNQFEAKDYNKIQERIKKSLMAKIENSSIKSNAQNRLISELQKIYILTSSMGWSLEYKGNIIPSTEAMEGIKL